MNSAKVGLLTIGQSPREDVVPEIKPFFLPRIKILEKGLLDNLSDCIGYKIEDKRNMQKSLSIPVLLPRVFLAFAINQHF